MGRVPHSPLPGGVEGAPGSPLPGGVEGAPGSPLPGGVEALNPDDLIPLESPSAAERAKIPRTVIGHNVGFDRSFVREQYDIRVRS